MRTDRVGIPLASGTNGSVVVDRCQVCGDRDLREVIFIGYLPPVNGMPAVGTKPAEEPAYPAQLLQCSRCSLAQLGLVVDPAVLFPPSYPYTSGTTRILRENFAELAAEMHALWTLRAEHLVVDVGSNDGTLLRNFAERGERVFGIEPTDAGKLAQSRDIPTLISFFGRDVAAKVRADQGPAQVVTATNVFAHIEDVHEVVDGVMELLDTTGIFVTESHYFASLVETVQYDTIYHEHLRYYTLTSLRYLLEAHGLEVIHAKRIPTHGGSIRVYSARRGQYPVRDSVQSILQAEQETLSPGALVRFKDRVVSSKLDLYGLLREIRGSGSRVYAVGAPSRATTLIQYVGLDHEIIDCVLEIDGSYKIGKYMPGTLIPVLEERRLFEDPPDYALLLSWHIADELIPKFRERGYSGKFIVPLPEPHIRS
jgi:hypothetical protein